MIFLSPFILSQIQDGKVSLIHLAITSNFDLTILRGISFYSIVCQFFVNGSPVASSAYVSSEHFSSPSWSTGDHLLFYPSGNDGGLWSGKIFSFSIYYQVN